MAIAAMIRMIATTIKSSIKEKPFCCFFMLSPSKRFGDVLNGHEPVTSTPRTVDRDQVYSTEMKELIWELRRAAKVQTDIFGHGGLTKTGAV
jgi:hypothetical protein